MLIINKDNMTNSANLSDDELKKQLSAEEYHILREKGTEAPFSSDLVNNHDKGMFTCKVCGQELFSSDAKFDSGTGWPSFDDAIPGTVKFTDDSSHGMERTEITCSNCGSHLGHVFNDGPSNSLSSLYSPCLAE
jgi:peptide-methionine (R)-S-oxide reductase